jgi:curved DNA-binding protein CbpA
MKWHPDKFSTASAAKKAEATAMFQEIGEANTVLSNPATRAFYDRMHIVLSEDDVKQFNRIEQAVKDFLAKIPKFPPELVGNSKISDTFTQLVEDIKKLAPELGNQYQSQFDQIVADAQKKAPPAVATPAVVAPSAKDLTQYLDLLLQRIKNYGVADEATANKFKMFLGNLREYYPGLADNYQKQYDAAVTAK